MAHSFTHSFILDSHDRVLYDDMQRRFDPQTRSWVAASTTSGDRVDAITAARWVQRESGCPCRVPVGVIGPRDASPAQLAMAEHIGRGLAAMGLPVICGGREGVMSAVAKGARSAGGTTIGLLPDTDASLANAYIDVVVATGIGEARNALIARASLCLVAIGDSYGTLSEVALGRHFGKRVIGLEGAAQVAGVIHVADGPAALALVAECALACTP
jgi:uncharacterized protein (TIGR00725 family)